MGEVGLGVGVEGGLVVLVLEVVEDYGCEGWGVLVEGSYFGVFGVVSFEFGSVEGWRVNLYGWEGLWICEMKFLFLFINNEF